MYPIPVVDNAATSIGNNLYSFTGVSANALVPNSYKFDGTTWTAIAPYPAPVEAPAAASDGTFAYIIGGANNSGASVNTFYRYDPATNAYTALAPAPTATWASAAVYLNGKIYKITGFVSTTTTTASNAVEIYDIATNTWTAATNYPAALAFVSAFSQGNYFYVAGGTAGPVASNTAKTYRYDPTANAWDDAAIADLPASRIGAATANYSGGAVLAGGFFDTNATNTAILWRLTTNTWVSLPNMLQARGRLAGGVANGAFYAIGGMPTFNNFVGTNDNQKLFCPPSNAPFIIGSVAYVSENGTPANNTPDPGETVTVSLDLQNVGGVNTGSNVTVTLQATGGIVPVTTSQSYGVLTAGAPVVSRNFTFTVPANAVCGSQITLTFVVTDGATTTNITKTYTLGILGPPGPPINFSNTAAITINDNAPATPYPSTISVAGLTSGNYNIKLKLSGLSHTWPSDIDVLLVGPGGQKFVVMSDVGGSSPVTGIDITLSDVAAQPLSTTLLTTGEFKPTNVDTTSDVFPAPAPAAPYENPGPAGTATFASTFGTTGTTFNGTWSLYVRDDISSDFGQIAGGWTLTFQIAPVQVCSTVSGAIKSRVDFDGDGKTDISVFRNGTWYVLNSTAGFTAANWGVAGDQLVPADYNGDGKTDFAIFRPTAAAGTLDFYVLNSTTNTLTGAEWGAPGDVAKVGDFVGDTKADYAVYRQSNNTWYILPSSGGAATVTTIAGTSGTFAPIALDYDGDGKSDIAQVSNGNWFIRRSGNATVANVFFGQAGDKFAPADYDNDNKDDLTVFRNGVWIALRSSNNTPVYINFGVAGDIPVPGDYDGDGADDQAVYRNGVWYINRSTGGFQAVSFGLNTDIPVPSVFVQ